MRTWISSTVHILDDGLRRHFRDVFKFDAARPKYLFDGAALSVPVLAIHIV